MSVSLQVCRSAGLQVCGLRSAVCGLRSASLQSAFVAHRVSTEARPVQEAVNAETVGEASSAPTVDKKR